MWSLLIKASAALLLAAVALPASGEPLSKQASPLAHELNKLESSVIQRRGKVQRTSDLLIGQNLKVSEQRLNTLKTRTPNSVRVPLLKRQFDRIRRQNRRFNH